MSIDDGWADTRGYMRVINTLRVEEVDQMRDVNANLLEALESLMKYSDRRDTVYAGETILARCRAAIANAREK